MEFIINHSVKFNANDNTLLGLEDSDESIILSRLCGELLCLFVGHNHQPLSREMLLHELWEKRGLNASSNNLNNYISMLRKALAHFGYEDVITTLPKYGFIFDAEIEMLNRAEGTSFIAQEIPGAEQGKNDTGLVNPRKNVLAVLLTSLLVLLAAGVFFSPELHHFLALRMARNEVFRLDRCRVFLADDTTRRLDPGSLKSRVQQIVHQESLDCQNNTNLYFYADNKSDADGNLLSRELLSYCPYNSKAPCENYYFTRHGEIGEGNIEK